MTVSKSKLLGAGLALAVAALVLLLWPRGEDDARTLIERQLINTVRAAEEKDLGFVMDQVSERFKSAEGWGKPEVKAVLAAQLFRGEWVRVFLTDYAVTVTSPNTAELRAQFVFGRSDAKSFKDLAKDSVVSAEQIDARLEKEADGEWRYVWAKHAQVDPSSLF
jgi:hypothetical protein